MQRVSSDDDEGDICAICLNEFVDPFKACSNGHIFCRECIKQIHVKVCPMCRTDIKIPDIATLPYTNLYETEDIISNKIIRTFISDSSKFQHNQISDIFDYEALTLLTSAKQNKTYILYKPIDESLLNFDNTLLTINDFSTWKVERLNNKIKYSYEVLVKIEVPCEYVLIDINYCNDSLSSSEKRNSQGDVIIVAGDYKVLDTYKTVMDLSYFVDENRDKLVIDNRNNIYFVSIDKLKYFCKVLGISRYTKMNRDLLVDSIIRRVSDRTVLRVALPI